MSRSLRITVPMNLDLEAGDIISVKLIDSMKGTDEWMSGLYIIKDLRHSYITADNGCLLYTSPSPRDVEESRMPSSA